jgi:hypothetical protein
VGTGDSSVATALISQLQQIALLQTVNKQPVNSLINAGLLQDFLQVIMLAVWMQLLPAVTVNSGGSSKAACYDFNRP